jgi:AbrB family looped-hinge helix DNA binding protein
MEAVTVRPGPRYRAVVPKAVREALGLRPGDAIIYIIRDGNVVVKRYPASFTDAMRGLHKHLWDDPDRWLEEEHTSWE